MIFSTEILAASHSCLKQLLASEGVGFGYIEEIGMLPLGEAARVPGLSCTKHC